MTEAGVSVWFLGAIAVATMIMAAIQIGAIICANRLARRVERLADRLEQEIQPLFASLQAVSRDAARATSLAVAQVERADRAITEVGKRVEQTASAVQGILVGPAREVVAVLSGIRAALAAFREVGEHTRPRAIHSEEEEALFIG